MVQKGCLLWISCIMVVKAVAQDDIPASLKVGDNAPALQVQWLKGTSVSKIEKGQVYVIEFWATWCKPCIAAMPHLSSLAKKYKGKATVIAVDVYESNTKQKVTSFVDSMGIQMDFAVAMEDSNFVQTAWLAATGDMGIPKSFVINGSGKIAWIGHPKMGLSEALSKIIKNKWDLQKFSHARNSENYLTYLDDSIGSELLQYAGDPINILDQGKPDSTLRIISKMLKREPKLKYAPNVSAFTFVSLLKLDPQRAYLFGKSMLSASKDPYHHIIFGNIKEYENKINLPPEIYLLGIEAYNGRMRCWPETADFPAIYHQIADWYWRIDQKTKAIQSEQKAIEALKTEKDFSRTTMAEYALRLQQYRKLLSESP